MNNKKQPLEMFDKIFFNIHRKIPVLESPINQFGGPQIWKKEIATQVFFCEY